jgi:hypothetical protein
MKATSLAAGVDPSTLPANQRAVNWLTPKLHGQMGAFSMVFGRNDAGQLGIGSAQVRRLPGISDAPGTIDLELSAVAAGDGRGCDSYHVTLSFSPANFYT